MRALMIWKSKSNFLQVDAETTIHFHTNFKIDENVNDRPVIIFNYGLVCNIEHFKYQIEFYDKQGYNIVLHDYRCHFDSICDTGIQTCTFVNISHDLSKLMDHLGIIKAHMIGHSMGVNVTLEFARLYPEKLSSMVLISGTVFPPQDIMFDSNIVDLAEPALIELRKQLGPIYDNLWANTYKNPLARFVVWQGGFNMKKTKIDFVEFYMKKIGELHPDLFFHLLNEMRKHDIINELELIDTPTLLIGGDKDKIIPNYLQRVLKKYLKNSSLYIVKDGSHVPQVDFPEYINQRSLNFTNKNLN